MKNLILCGFMGSGKTTVGRQLARQYALEYIDLDEQIERESEMRIPEIFARFGEQEFREREHLAVCALAKRIKCVVATGGGALTFARNRDAIDPRDTVIFLDAPFEVCLKRIEGSDRPILRERTPEQFRALFEERRIAYLKACENGLHLDASAGVSAVAAALAAQIQVLAKTL